MVFPNIEKIKQEYTDKYVVVDAQRPELARFADVVGQVKTVNMSGRALVEFLDYHLNIGWYDIELEFLKVVDKPEPKAKEDKKPAPKAEAKPAAAKAAPVAKPAAAGKPSTSDILAKLRGGGGAAPTAKKEEAPKPKPEAKPSVAETTSPAKVDRAKMSVAEMLAAARANKPAPPGAKSVPAEAKPVASTSASVAKEKAPSSAPAAPSGEPQKLDRSNMSVADMLAAARAGKGGAPATSSEPKAEAPAPAPKEAPAPAPAAEAASPAPAKAEGGIVKIDKSGMSIAEMVAYCRETDAE